MRWLIFEHTITRCNRRQTVTAEHHPGRCICCCQVHNCLQTNLPQRGVIDAILNSVRDITSCYNSALNCLVEVAKLKAVVAFAAVAKRAKYAYGLISRKLRKVVRTCTPFRNQYNMIIMCNIAQLSLHVESIFSSMRPRCVHHDKHAYMHLGKKDSRRPLKPDIDIWGRP